MTHDAGFLRAILENPDDDTPRLIYADWLDDNGDPTRAEFIRLQCDLARLDETDPRRGALEARCRELEYDHREGWRGEAATFGRGHTFERGFIERIEFDKYTEFLNAAPRLFGLAPIRHVTIKTPFFHFTRWSRSPYLTRLRGLALQRYGHRKWD